jgi:hypothetical protein
MATLEELQAKITRLEDIRQIKGLQKIYGCYRDYGVYTGKEGVRRFCVDLLGGGNNKPPRPGTLSIVFQQQGVVTVAPDGKTARGRWYGGPPHRFPA